MESNGPHGCSGNEPVQLVQIRPRPLGRVRFEQLCDPLILELERSLDGTRVLSRALDAPQEGERL